MSDTASGSSDKPGRKPGQTAVGTAEPDKEQGPSATGDDDGNATDDVAPGANRKKRPNRRRKQEPPPKVVEVAPMAPRAQFKRRHWGLLASFVVIVILPAAVTAWYLWTVAQDQYASTVGFTIRQEETGVAADLLGGFASSLGGGGASRDTDILYEYIQSQDLVRRIDDKLGLTEHYSTRWPDDPAFALWPDATIEALMWYWSRVVQVSYDANSGLIELRIIAFDPDTAHSIAQSILIESQQLINDLNAQARADTMRYAEEDLAEAQDRVRDSREALTVFRTSTQIVDPATDVQGRMGVVNTLQQQLAAALIERDLLAEQSSAGDPRVNQAERRIEVIRARIAEERRNFASGAETPDGQDYPSLIAEYEGLVVDREFAEESYRAALAALDVARNNASRQSRYLAAYVRPTLPETAEFPRRITIFGLVAFFSFLTWSILALIYYSIRDSR